MAQQTIRKRPIPNKNNLKIKRKMYRKRIPRRKIKRLMILSALLFIILFLLFSIIKIVFTTISKDAISNNTVKTGDEVKSNNKVKNIPIKIVNDRANIKKYYIYGTYFNIEGTIDVSNTKEMKNICLILINEDGKETKQDLKYKINSDNISFETSNNYNEGTYLDGLKEGNYNAFIKVIHDNSNSEYYSMTNKTSYKNTEYYTITKNQSNNKIEINFGKYKNYSCMKISVEKSSLPKDVYDIAIDAGHGGIDTGACNGKYFESEITLKYAKALKNSLEKSGLKVKLTRDGTENSNDSMAFTMYDKNGRVNKACASKAKYCFSIHLNSNKEKLQKGGLQIYCNSNINTDFAKNIAENIVKYTDINCSDMESYRVAQGVYIRNFTQDEISSSNNYAKSKGFDSYNITTDTNYYFMIRELGGIVTNAYVDGRNPKYGKNEYYNSNIGIESYLMEIGYITVNKDLNYILNEQDDYIKALTKSIEKEIGLNK